MRLARIRFSDASIGVGVIEDDAVRVVDLDRAADCHCLADLLHVDDPVSLVNSLIAPDVRAIPLSDVQLLAPVDRQDVWAAGVTYRRSQRARMEESETGASHYDRVYTAARPELFCKATPERVCGPDEVVRVRFDSDWTVPEPEFTLVIAPDGRLVGYTIGNDMSARDIEGENPLYLPQAKMYNQSCAVGPCILVAGESLDRPATKIVLTVDRRGETVFQGETDLGQMARTFEDLIGWLYRESEFPHGALLLTGTGIVPPDEFSLEDGDVVFIEVTGIGTLRNPVVKQAMHRP